MCRVSLLRHMFVPLNNFIQLVTKNTELTLVVHESSAELLEGSAVAHGTEGAVELVVGHHQVLGVPGHVDDLHMKYTPVNRRLLPVS